MFIGYTILQFHEVPRSVACAGYELLTYPHNMATKQGESWHALRYSMLLLV
jgi:predicted amidohydrolase